MIKKQLSKYLLITLGIILLSFYIWFRFIRERLPRDIPFNLTLLGIILLVYICCIYLFIIITLVFEYKPKNAFISNIISKFIYYIYKPLTTLDEVIKTNIIVKPYYERCLIYFITIGKKFNTYYTKDTKRDYYNIYILFQIFPRVILVTALLIDTFYFYCLFLLYKVIYIGILILIGKYILYSLKYAKEQYILQLEYMVDGIITDYNEDEPGSGIGSFLPVRRFMDEQIFSIVFNAHSYYYGPMTSDNYDNDYRKRHSLPASYMLTNNDRKLNKIDFYNLMEIVIPLSVHIDEYDLRGEFSSMERMKIEIYSLYLTCWLYILIVSFNYIDFSFIANFELFKLLINKEEPFSGMDISY